MLVGSQSSSHHPKSAYSLLISKHILIVKKNNIISDFFFSFLVSNKDKSGISVLFLFKWIYQLTFWL